MKLTSLVYRLSYFTMLICLVIACASPNKSKNTITVFAAASVSDVMNEIAKEFQKETGISVRLNYASSGILARQIESGAGFDCYVSASKDWVDYLDSLELLDEESIRSIAQNSMVAIVPIQDIQTTISDQDIGNFPNLFNGRLSVGDPTHVPAGKYAMQILQNNSWEKNLESRILPAKDVRDALFMVEMGEVEMGLVYFSDAKKSKKVRTVYEFPKDKCDPILYFSALNKISNENLKLFGKFLNGEKAKSIWRDNSFKMN